MKFYGEIMLTVLDQQYNLRKKNQGQHGAERYPNPQPFFIIIVIFKINALKDFDSVLTVLGHIKVFVKLKT